MSPPRPCEVGKGAERNGVAVHEHDQRDDGEDGDQANDQLQSDGDEATVGRKAPRHLRCSDERDDEAAELPLEIGGANRELVVQHRESVFSEAQLEILERAFPSMG